MKSCQSCGSQNQTNAKFCMECGEKFILTVAEQEKEIKRRIVQVAEAKVEALENGLYMQNKQEFINILINYHSEIKSLIKFQEEHLTELIDAYISIREVTRDSKYYKAMIANGISFEELLEEDEIINDVYFTPAQVEQLRNSLYIGDKDKLFPNIDPLCSLRENFIRINKSLGRIYTKKNTQQEEFIETEDFSDFLEVADAALAFLSPVSAARYVIKKMKEDD